MADSHVRSTLDFGFHRVIFHVSVAPTVNANITAVYIRSRDKNSSAYI